MRRRSYLAALSSVGGALAGCLSSGTSPTATPADGTATETRTATAVPEYLHCETAVTPTTPDSGGWRRRSYPSLPEELTSQSARQFVTEFEQARQVNRLASNYGTRVVYIDFKHSQTDVRTVEYGYLVTYTDELGYGYASDEQRTVHGDDPFTVTYFVAPTLARRREGTGDPREPGASEIVVCRPDG